MRRRPSGLDPRLVDFGTGLIDHHDGTILAIGVQIGSDLTRDQVGGSSGVARVSAIQPDRIFQPTRSAIAK
jgi:hypothetical protein